MLNHFYVVTDHDTYAAIEESRFLKEEFAAFEKRTTVRADQTYTGIYFYGRETYLEFMEPSTSRKAGVTAVAFGSDAPIGPIGSLKPIKITREWNGKQIPWFLMTAPSWAKQSDPFVTWLMEYQPEFLAQWHPEAGTAPGAVSRATVLERYKAVPPATLKSQPLMEDVIGLTLAVKPESRLRFQEWMASIGSTFPMQFVDPGAGIEGVRAAEFCLSRKPDKDETLLFGSHSILTLRRDGTALWRFD